MSKLKGKVDQPARHSNFKKLTRFLKICIIRVIVKNYNIYYLFVRKQRMKNWKLFPLNHPLNTLTLDVRTFTWFIAVRALIFHINICLNLEILHENADYVVWWAVSTMYSCFKTNITSRQCVYIFKVTHMKYWLITVKAILYHAKSSNKEE